ncbi:hypothetical protein ACIPUC_00675 [Streptomyces sp. LARHCF249]
MYTGAADIQRRVSGELVVIQQQLDNPRLWSSRTVSPTRKPVTGAPPVSPTPCRRSPRPWPPPVASPASRPCRPSKALLDRVGLGLLDDAKGTDGR